MSDDFKWWSHYLFIFRGSPHIDEEPKVRESTVRWPRWHLCRQRRIDKRSENSCRQCTNQQFKHTHIQLLTTTRYTVFSAEINWGKNTPLDFVLENFICSRFWVNHFVFSCFFFYGNVLLGKCNFCFGWVPICFYFYCSKL